MHKLKRTFGNLLIVVMPGLILAILVQFFTHDPVDRYIHITSFRYGKEPSVIRCNRGDRLHLTFSTDDTGHSFFLEEFDIDIKVSPSREQVEVFKTSNPTEKQLITKEYVLTAKHPGIYNYIVSRSNYRCHVWCGPMHAFEQGKIIILPNTLLAFSISSLAGIILLWLLGIFSKQHSLKESTAKPTPKDDLFLRFPFLKKMARSRWLQAILILLSMIMIYVVILTSVFGTQMSGRNLGVLLMWAVWLFLLVAILTPFMGRIWCTICPLPFFGDLIQRQSLFSPLKGRTKSYNNKFTGFFLKWPKKLDNNWLKLFVFLALATFSTTLVAKPRISGFVLVGLLLAPTAMSIIWELRAFCRYVCPVSVFIGPFSRMSTVVLGSKSQERCDTCKPNYCEKGSPQGWACPYGINVGKIDENPDCGLCMECTRSCLYDNVTIYTRPLASEVGTRNLSEAWMTLSIFTISIVYSILYLGHWPIVRDYINILDKQNWDLFGQYAIVLWTLALVVTPAMVYLLSLGAKKLSNSPFSVKEIFMASSGALLPLGLMIWIAFVVPMLFVNVTFIEQSFSDPFGWGWDFFGTANIPWHQFIPRFIPWIQAALILSGAWLSLRNNKHSWNKTDLTAGQLFRLLLPTSLLIIVTAVGMLLFFTN